MPRILSPAAARATLARETEEVLLQCLTIEAGETFRLVNNTETVMRAVGDYRPYPFEPVLPDDSDSAGQLTIRLDNIDRRVTELVTSFEGVPLVTVELVLASSPDVVEFGPCRFSVVGSEFDAMVISLALDFEEDFLGQSVPAQTYSPSNSPGLFR
jgi:hypothetical protein